MIKEEDIYVGARIVTSDPEHPVAAVIKGTVQKLAKLSNVDPYGYFTTVLPDAEFRELPEIKGNTLYGLINCLGFTMDALPKEEKPDKYPRQLQQFKINIQIKGLSDCTVQQKHQAFYDDILTLLDMYGYQIDAPKLSGACPEARKDRSRIYCHPMELAGECPPEAFEELEKMLRQGASYEVKRVELAKSRVFDYSDEEELEQYHLKYDTTIREQMLDAFRTDSPDKFKVTYKIIDELACQIKIVTILNYMISGDDFANYRYLQSVYDTLLEEGKIIIGPKQPDDGYITRSRSIN